MPGALIYSVRLTKSKTSVSGNISDISLWDDADSGAFHRLFGKFVGLGELGGRNLTLPSMASMRAGYPGSLKRPVRDLTAVIRGSGIWGRSRISDSRFARVPVDVPVHQLIHPFCTELRAQLRNFLGKPGARSQPYGSHCWTRRQSRSSSREQRLSSVQESRNPVFLSTPMILDATL